jgi:hypothetical protein
MLLLPYIIFLTIFNTLLMGVIISLEFDDPQNNTQCCGDISKVLGFYTRRTKT